MPAQHTRSQTSRTGRISRSKKSRFTSSNPRASDTTDHRLTAESAAATAYSSAAIARMWRGSKRMLNAAYCKTLQYDAEASSQLPAHAILPLTSLATWPPGTEEQVIFPDKSRTQRPLPQTACPEMVM